jgi:hypothetical protein
MITKTIKELAEGAEFRTLLTRRLGTVVDNRFDKPRDGIEVLFGGVWREEKRLHPDVRIEDLESISPHYQREQTTKTKRDGTGRG